MRNIQVTKQTLRFSLGVVSVILLALLTMLPINMGTVRAQASCTLETIKGTYIFQGVGVVMNEGELRSYAEAGVWTLDGSGNASGVISASMNGVPFATRQAFTATYEHTSDCVYSVVDEFGLTFDMYTTPTGIPMTYFSPGFSGIQLKQ
jgi:hypothetical protein